MGLGSFRFCSKTAKLPIVSFLGSETLFSFMFFRNDQKDCLNKNLDLRNAAD